MQNGKEKGSDEDKDLKGFHRPGRKSNTIEDNLGNDNVPNPKQNIRIPPFQESQKRTAVLVGL